MRLLIAIVFSLSCVVVSAQTGPFIESIAPAITYPGDTIVISGTGFPTTVSKVQVWFGQVSGSVISTSDFSIEVAVPASARYGGVEVLDLDSKLSAKSELKFHPYFSGNAFEASLMKPGASISNPEMLFDLCTCDLNADGKPDIAASKFDNSTNLLVLKNGSTPGNLSFTAQNANVGVFTEEMTCGDLNGDGKPELIASRSGGSAGGQRNSIFILKNTSTGGAISFDSPIGRFFTSGMQGHARYIVIKDLNLDGKPEIIVSNSFNNDLYIFVNESTGGTLSIKAEPIRITIPNATNSYGIELQDLDGDRRPEIVFTQFQLSGMYIMKNLSGQEISFADPQALTGAGYLGFYNKLVAADFNEDGQMDFAGSDWTSSKVTVWINKTNGAATFSFAALPLLDADVKPDGMDVGDIDGDQDIDIVVATRGSNFMNVFINSGDNAAVSFAAKKQISAGKNQRNIVLADLDGDAKPEMAVTASNVSNQHSLDIYRNANCFIAKALTESAAICPGQGFLLESIPNYAAVTGGATFTWKQDGSNKSSPAKWNFNATQPGVYTVSVSSENNSCNSTSSSITLTPGTGAVPPDPDLSSSGAVVCAGKNLTLMAKSLSGASYVWKGPDNFSSTTSTNSVVISSVTKDNAGEYSVQITQGFCKSEVDKVIVGVANVDGFTVTSSSSTNSVCAGSPLKLSAPLVDGYNYQWKKGTANASSTTSSLSVTESGAYSVVVSSAALGSSCSKESPSVTVKVLSIPDAKWSTTGSLCKNSEVTFTSTSTMDNQGTPVYEWVFGDNGRGSTSPAKHTYATANTFTASLKVSYSGVAGCTDTETKSLVVTDGSTPAISSTVTEICPDDEIALNVTGGAFSSYSWSPSGTGNPLIVTTGGEYTVTTTDVNGCTAMASFTMTNKPVPDVSVTPGDTTVAVGSTFQFQVTGGETYEWTPAASLDNPLIPNPLATPLVSTTYTVVVKTTDQCDVTRDILVAVEGSLDIPNVFTPNNDGNNDSWLIPGGPAMPDCLVSIFDGAGARILDEYANNLEWDGTFNGKPVPQGVYYFIMSCPNSSPITGNILVAR